MRVTRLPDRAVQQVCRRGALSSPWYLLGAQVFEAQCSEFRATILIGRYQKSALAGGAIQRKIALALLTPAGGFPMEIWVEFDNSTGKFRTSPDPAMVKRGSVVRWRFRTDNAPKAVRIRWSAYFKQETNPLSGERPVVYTFSGNADGQHSGTTETVFVDAPAGDYKYGVRAEDASAEKELGNDDPVLRVLA